MVQLHKEFADSQVKELVERYLRKEIPIQSSYNISNNKSMLIK